MQIGSCFSYDSASDVYYNYPNLSCIDGSPLPSFDTTIRETYFKRGGRLVKGSSEVVTYSDVHSYIGYVYDYNKIPLYDENIVLLVCSLFVISLFAIIYRWFFRLRA